MSIKIKISGAPIDLADDLEEEFHQEAKDAVEGAAEILLSTIQGLLSRITTGDAPEGQPPAMDTGKLYRSFRTIRPKVKGRVATSGIESRHPGGYRLEHGFTDFRGIRTLPHPFIRPAVEQSRDAVGAYLATRFGGTDG